MREFRVQSSEFRIILNSFCLLLLAFGFLLFATPVFAQEPTSSPLSTNSCRADSMQNYTQTYGFNTPNNSGYSYPSPIDPNRQAEFSLLKEKTTKYASEVGIDPVLVVWWSFFESGARVDSYFRSNCLDRDRNVNTNCAAISSPQTVKRSGNWQLGYGQQFATYTSLPKAFQAAYGDPSDIAKTKQVGQNVLDKANQQKTFPDKSVTQLVNETNANNVDSIYWTSVLMRDPDLSAYLTAVGLKIDIDGAALQRKLYRDYVYGFNAYYRNNWQPTSNLLNDVLLAWNATTADADNLRRCADLNKTKSPITNPSSPDSNISGSREEIAVYNISNANLPPEIVNKPVPDENGIIKALKDAAGFVGSFFSSPTQPGKYYAQSERINKGDVPDQIIPKQGSNFLENLLSFVGKNTGFYSNYLPPEFVSEQKVLGVNLTTNPATLVKPKDIKDFEQAFETTHFPDGIAPVTGSRTTNPPSTTTTPTSSAPSTPGQFNTALEQQMIGMVNAERAKAGVPPLTFDPTLLPLARDMAAELPNIYNNGNVNTTLFYSHTNSKGEDLAKRANRLGIKDRPIYENLSYAQDINQSMQGLLASKLGHKENMLQPQLTKIAIGVFQGEGMVFVAQIFK